MSVRSIKAGKAYVELGVNNKALLKGLKRAQQHLNSFASTVGTIGAKLGLLGAAMAAPFGAAVKAMSDLEYELANLQGAANPTVEEFKAIRKAISQVSAATGMLEKDVAKSFNELIKAGVPVKAVIDGMGEAAVQFAEVGGLDFERAAVTMTNALYLFGAEVGSATKAIDMLSAAADASTTDINYIAWSFQMSSAVFKQANQSLRDLTASIALMANEGIKGSDAGTSLKSMMLSLIAPTSQASKIMRDLGVDVRDANREMRPMLEIISEFKRAMAGMNAEVRDDVFKRLFGTDAIRAASIILSGGTDKFQKMIDTMGTANTVSQKFALLLASTKKQLDLVWASVMRLSVAIGEALSPTVKAVAFGLRVIVESTKQFVAANTKLVVIAFAATSAVVGLGVALIGIAIAAKAAAIAIGVLLLPAQLLSFTFTVLSTVMGVLVPLFLLMSGVIVGPLVSAFGALTAVVGFVVTGLLSLTGVILGALGSALVFLAGVAFTIYGVFALVGAAIYMFFDSIMAIVKKVMPAINSLVAVFIRLGTILLDVGKILWQFVKVVFSLIKPITYMVLVIGRSVMALIGGIVNVIGWFVKVIAVTFSVIGMFFNALSSTIMDTFSIIANVINKTMSTIVTAVSILAGAIGDVVSSILGGILSVVSTIAGGILNVLSVVFGAIISVVSGIIGVITQSLGFLINIVSNIILLVADVFAFLFDALGLVVGAVVWFVDSVVGAFKWLSQAIVVAFQWIGDTISTVVAFIGPVVQGVLSAVGSIWSGVRTFFRQVGSEFGLMVGAISDGSFTEAAKGVVKDTYNMAADIGGGFLVVGDTTSRALGFVSQGFDSFAKGGSAAYDKILKAFQSGNIEAAMKVMWATLKWAWVAGTTYIGGIWDSAYTALLQTAFTVWHAIIEVGESAFTAIANGWDWLIGAMQNTFGELMTAMKKGWASLDAFIQSGYIVAESTIIGRSDEDMAQLLRMVDQEEKARKDRYEREGRMSPEEREAERIARAEGRIKRLSNALAKNDELLQQRVDGLGKANAEKLKAAEMEMLYTQQALEESLAVIDTSAAPAEESDISNWLDGLRSKLDSDIGNLRDTLDVEGIASTVSAKFDQIGGFSAIGFDRLGIGQTAMERTARASETVAENTGTIVKQNREGIRHT